jgi:hypothetical protein
VYRPLVKSGALLNVRHLCLMIDEEEGLAEFVASLPRLETLQLEEAAVPTERLFRARLPNLHTLVVAHAASYDLKALAANRSLAGLEELKRHPYRVGHHVDPLIRLDGVRALVRSPHLKSLKRLSLQRSDMGDAGVREIVQSGILSRLEELDLSLGCITDEGARLLAAAPDYPHLKTLEVMMNWLSTAGARALRRKGPKVTGASHQLDHGVESGYRET